MTKLDVTQLTKESLSSGTFPASMAADFRLFFQPEVHAEILSHAAEDTSFEICGILVGRWESDNNGPYAVISNRIRCDNASSKLAEVTFTHESWAQINQEMDTKYSDLRIIGWYHSHPDFGIFLSDRDVFIQENFFSGAGQVAFVVDPVRRTEGVFEWRDGKPELMLQYWVGNSMITRAASGTENAAPARTSRESTASAAVSTATVSDTSLQYPIGRESSLGAITTVLGWCCLFLLGYLLAGQRSHWEQTMLREGTVAHYGLWNLLKPGWEAELQKASADLNSIAGDLKTLSDEHVSLSDGDKKELRSKWLSIRKKVDASQKTLSRVQIAAKFNTGCAGTPIADAALTIAA
ncbi:MAG: Mov34/MPN/PAD-1 family protein [Rhodopirellula sp.]|nr:Mov34/MPN/PAD-1 family protein [Rhodopirellula sp.]